MGRKKKEDLVGEEGVEMETPGSEDFSEFENSEYNPFDYRVSASGVSFDAEQESHFEELNDEIAQVFENSRWVALNPRKKLPKDLVPLVFQDVVEGVKTEKYSFIEKFVCICDYINVSYNKAYGAIHSRYREQILQELDKKYGVLSRKGKSKKII
jgi:hypothetical protein